MSSGRIPSVQNASALAGTTLATNITASSLTSLGVTTTNGDILYGTGSGALARLGIGSSGQILNVASGIPAWATASASALTLVKARTSFSNVASTTTSFDSMFSSTYYNYIIVIDGFTAVTANATLMFQWRSGGTTYAGGNYYSGYNNLTWNGSSAPVGNSGGTYVSIATLAGAGNFAAFTVNYYHTNTADTNAKLAWTGYSPQLQGNINGSGFVNAATNWDGFILSMSTGNIYTGSVTVYGLAKA